MTDDNCLDDSWLDDDDLGWDDGEDLDWDE